MKVLLDECVPKRLAREFPGHQVKHVTDMGWTTIKNGKLLALAEQSFEVFLTVDKNLSFQQHLPGFRIAVLCCWCAPQAIVSRTYNRSHHGFFPHFQNASLGG